jgi:hypothetical protein
LQTDRWKVPAKFGESDSADGIRFRVFVLVTTADLPVGKITNDVPQDSQELFEVMVTLRK